MEGKLKRKYWSVLGGKVGSMTKTFVRVDSIGKLLTKSKNRLISDIRVFQQNLSLRNVVKFLSEKFLSFLHKLIFFRVFVGKLQPPVIPFMPLLLKDMTFAHEGNKTSLDGLVNFEKMHMMAQTMRTIRFCRSRHLGMCCKY